MGRKVAWDEVGASKDANGRRAPGVGKSEVHGGFKGIDAWHGAGAGKASVREHGEAKHARRERDEAKHAGRERAEAKACRKGAW